jgi:hypothetical protein
MKDAGAARRHWADTWIAPAIVVAATTAAFLRALGGGFVWDDHEAVELNPHVQNPASWLGLVFDKAAVNQFGFVRPLRTLEFAFDRALFGPGPLSFHVHSLLWHVAASVLLLLVLRRLLGDGRANPAAGGVRTTRGHGAALVGALLWAVHPVQVETVAWVACRGDVAMAACVFASTLFALRSEGFDRHLALSLAAAALAPLYKETGLALPAVIAALRWTKLARAPLWPYAAVVVAYAGYRFVMRGDATSDVAPFLLGGSVVGAVATMFRSFGFYVVESLLPAQTADWYLSPSTTLADVAALSWLAVHAALVASAVVARRRAPLWTVSVACFYAFLLPVSNLPPLYVGVPTAERYLYVSLAGVALAVGWALTRVPRATAPAAVVVAALGVASVARCGMWRDDDALWDAVAADHASTRVDETIGNRMRAASAAAATRAAALPAGRERDAQQAESRRFLELALERYHAIVAFWLEYEGPFRGTHSGALRGETNASYVCWLLGRDQEALFHAEQAIAIDDSSPGAHFDRSVSLLRLGFAPQAVASMRAARDRGFSAPDVRIGSILFDAAGACERDALPATARAGYEAAAEAFPDGPMRLRAAERRDALVGAVVPDAGELARLAASDAELARLPRSCPVRRDSARSD